MRFTSPIRMYGEGPIIFLILTFRYRPPTLMNFTGIIEFSCTKFSSEVGHFIMPEKAYPVIIYCDSAGTVLPATIPAVPDLTQSLQLHQT